ncbi:MAG: prepilin peptidase [Proteobacteria bacterium]|nr:MAG: prepilin peptidase [Pseudomonadota bacterium]
MLTSTLGEINLVYAVIFITTAISFYTDLVYRKIFNVVTVFGMLSGVGLAVVNSGFSGFFAALLGMGAAILMFGWLFVFRVLGAGDVKLLMALGALGGARYCAETAILSLLVAAVIGVVQLVLLGKFSVFLRKLKRLFVSVLVRGMSIEMPQVDQSVKMPFGVAIGVASIWLIVESPFVRWGIELWH